MDRRKKGNRPPNDPGAGSNRGRSSDVDQNCRDSREDDDGLVRPGPSSLPRLAPAGDHLFHDWRAQREWDELRFEDEIVLHLLAHYRISKAVRNEMAEDEFRRSGIRRLTFEAFQAITGFPVFVVCRRIAKVAEQCPVSRLFADFGRRIIVKKYFEAADEYPDIAHRMPLGLVFPWPNLTESRGLVLHNRQPVFAVPGSRMVWVSGETQLVLSPLSVLLAEIDHCGFRPADAAYSPP